MPAPGSQRWLLKGGPKDDLIIERSGTFQVRKDLRIENGYLRDDRLFIIACDDTKGVKVAVNRSCFELWLLLHRAEETRLGPPTDGAAVVAELPRVLGKYDKTNLLADHYPLAAVAPACVRVGLRMTIHNKLTLAVIGLGVMGRGHVMTAQRSPRIYWIPSSPMRRSSPLPTRLIGRSPLPASSAAFQPWWKSPLQTLSIMPPQS